MLTQRLLNILRLFNNPDNVDKTFKVELIEQDIVFLNQYDFDIQIIERNSITLICLISRKQNNIELETNGLKP